MDLNTEIGLIVSLDPSPMEQLLLRLRNVLTRHLRLLMDLPHTDEETETDEEIAAHNLFDGSLMRFPRRVFDALGCILQRSEPPELRVYAAIALHYCIKFRDPSCWKMITRPSREYILMKLINTVKYENDDGTIKIISIILADLTLFIDFDRLEPTILLFLFSGVNRLEKFTLSLMETTPKLLNLFGPVTDKRINEGSGELSDLIFERFLVFLSSNVFIDMRICTVKALVNLLTIAPEKALTDKFDCLVTFAFRSIRDVILQGTNEEEQKEASNLLNLFAIKKHTFLTNSKGRIRSVMAYMVIIAAGHRTSEVTQFRAIRLYTTIAEGSTTNLLQPWIVLNMFFILINLVADIGLEPKWNGSNVIAENHCDVEDHDAQTKWIFAEIHLGIMVEKVGAIHVFRIVKDRLLMYTNEMPWSTKYAAMRGFLILCKRLTKGMKKEHPRIMVSACLRLLKDPYLCVKWEAATCLKLIGKALHEQFPRETLMQYKDRVRTALGVFVNSELHPPLVKDHMREAFDAFDTEGEPVFDAEGNRFVDTRQS